MKSPAYKYKSVLLIDDNELDNFINQKTIEAAHFAKNIYINTSAKSAIEFLDNLSRIDAKPGDFPQVVFVDINMPAMDGFQFLTTYGERLKQLSSDIRIVILTSSLSPHDEVRAGELPGGVQFVRKPLSSDTLGRI
jgi:CheY-like chemotaxis protein